MTTMINLLPWREERRKQRQHEFIAMLAFAALLAGLIFWLWKGMVEGQIADQQTRNNHIQSEIAKLDTQIKEIISCGGNHMYFQGHLGFGAIQFFQQFFYPFQHRTCVFNDKGTVIGVKPEKANTRSHNLLQGFFQARRG